MTTTTNRLIHASSPYLLQHAHNPVDWYEWGTEALDKAKLEDKPILVSIGYSSCHWCHVMERESFEKENIAAIMNEFFVCIKVDREERPDIDQIYMDAVHALGIQGGWPLNVFLTPEQKPFFGGTYFSPQTWIQVLNNISKAFQSARDQIEASAEELRLHLLRSETEQFTQQHEASSFLAEADEMFKKLEQQFDSTWGGMDKTPKFVMPSIWLWLLRYYYITKNEAALAQVSLTLKRIAMGGIYDQIGGGFARYSVDKYWFAPHFEKMLYDNAQLISLYSEAYSVTKDQEFKTVVYETFDWLQREMTSDQGGFYSALDADSEGVEGKYYIWTEEEIRKHLREDSKLFSSYYGIEPAGNWEHGASILMRKKTDEDFFRENNLVKNEWLEKLKANKKILLRERSARIPPGLDDKMITSWNAMMISGLTDAYRAFGDKRFLKAATYTMRFLENELMEGVTVYRSYKNKRSGVQGFLDDYAFVIQAQINLYQVTFEEYWVNRAFVFTENVIDKFYDDQNGFFYFTSRESEKLIARKKEVFDNVIPSSNSVMAHNLFMLGTLLDNENWKNMARNMTYSLSHLIKNEPNYMSHWAIAYTAMKKGLVEIAILGKDHDELRNQFHRIYHPLSVALGTKTKSELPLLKDKDVKGEKPALYVCYNKTCGLPVNSLEKAIKQIEKVMED